MISRTAFNREVEQFQQTHNKKLAQCLDSAETAKAFFEKPVIHAYLSRNDKHVTFSKRHPKLFDSKRKYQHARTDHYELAVYRAVPQVIAYRSSCITSPDFYNSYTDDDTAEYFSEKLKRLNDQTPDINVDHRILDSEDVARDITLASLQGQTGKPSARFRIYSTTDYAHTTTLLVVMHPTTFKPLIAISLNSSNDDEHFTHIQSCLLKKQQFSTFDSDMPLLNHYFTRVFGVDVDDESLCSTPDLMLENVSSNAVCLVLSIGRKEKALHTFQGAGSVFGLKKRTYLSALRGTPEPAQIFLVHQPRYPVISAAHDLQQEHETDNNCVLYSMQFIQALVDFLHNPLNADLVFQYAEEAEKNNIRAQNKLFYMFNRSLRPYLPNYYDSKTRKPKSPQQLREFHLRQRWNIGSESLSMFYPIKSDITQQATADEVILRPTPRK